MQNLTTRPGDKLKAARRRISNALAELIPVEGHVLDFDTAEAVYKQLAGAQRELKEVQITVAVMERRATNV